MGFFDRYPYTNWHNVNLDWVLERVKEWGQMVEANDQAFKDLEEANASFKEYVTNYLQDLDVQAAIDDKIDRMFESGELTTYFQPYVSTVVTNWLDDHITEPEGVVIDSSLTVAGAAADSKATGYEIGRVRGIAELYGFSDTSKQALLDCFMNVAWINGNGRLFFNALESSFNMGWNNKTHWSLTDGLSINMGNLVSELFPKLVTNTGSSNRALVTCNKGIGDIYNYNANNPIPFEPKRFPIPVPFGAKRFTVDVESGFAVITNIYRYMGENEYVVAQNYPSALPSTGGGTRDITVEGSNLYIPFMILTANNAIPNRFNITFEFEDTL